MLMALVVLLLIAPNAFANAEYFGFYPGTPNHEALNCSSAFIFQL